LQSRRWRTFTLSALASLSADDIAFEPAHRFFGKASRLTEAAFHIPGTKLELGLDRRCIHIFLAEYERTLVLRNAGRELLRQVIAVDTGGYTRMNVYRISSSVYYLQGLLGNDTYFLDIATPSVTGNAEWKRPVDAEFLGAFDRDEKGWRFIAASERPEIRSVS
jgi:hypothetical protein